MKKAAFITGLIGGIICVIYSILVFISAVSAIRISWLSALVFFSVSLSIVGFVGACICRGHGAGGGIMMLVSGVYSIIIGIVIMGIDTPKCDSIVTGLLLVMFEITLIVAGILAIASRNYPWVSTKRVKMEYMPQTNQQPPVGR